MRLTQSPPNPTRIPTPDPEPTGMSSDPPMRSRGYLPHADHPWLVQLVTFRLADTMPARLLEQWREELAHLGDDEAAKQVRRRYQRYLDEGAGACYLREPEVADMLRDVLLHDRGVVYDLRAWVIMPNHVHLVLRVCQGYSLSTALERIKGVSAHRANKILGRSGQFWAREWYDRYARDGDHIEQAVAYVRANPVKAGLCERPEDWPWLGVLPWPARG
ncbi:MAG TPA: transposase [Armatimonadetes bacterium]|nr:transposase [Armatimonadota bacterium]